VVLSVISQGGSRLYRGFCSLRGPSLTGTLWSSEDEIDILKEDSPDPAAGQGFHQRVLTFAVSRRRVKSKTYGIGVRRGYRSSLAGTDLYQAASIHYGNTVDISNKR